MSELKFACPVCGQHITADSRDSGSHLDCPTCFRKIVVPQARSDSDTKFILSAAEANRGRRPTGAIPAEAPAKTDSHQRKIPVGMIFFFLLLCGAGAAFFVFHDQLTHIIQSVRERENGNPTASPTNSQSFSGAIGLGSWNTAVEYSNVVVSSGSKVLFCSDFNSGSKGWSFHRGTWIATNGVMEQLKIQEDCRAVAGERDWKDYVLTLRARKLAGQEGFLILFHVADDNNWTWLNLGGWKNTRDQIERCISGNKSLVGPPVAGQIERRRWYDIRVELHGPQIRCYLDHNLIMDVSYPPD